MFTNEFSTEVSINRVSNGATAGTTAVTSSAIDTSGYAACAFVASLGTVTSGCVLQLTAYENSTDSNSGGTAVTGGQTASYTAGSSSSNTDLVVDVQRPAKRYAYCTLTRSTDNAVVNCVYALLYKANVLPVTQPATVVELQLSSPEV